MAYNEKLADRVREALADEPDVTEKKMFSGVCFIVNGKMCVCVSGDELMCRVGSDVQEEALQKNGTRAMVMRGKTMKDYVYVSADVLNTKNEFNYWIAKCLAFNPFAKASKKSNT